MGLAYAKRKSNEQWFRRIALQSFKRSPWQIHNILPDRCGINALKKLSLSPQKK